MSNPSAPSPAKVALPSIPNCLSCGHCSLEGDTDFRWRGAIVHCNAPVEVDLSVPLQEFLPDRVGRKPVNLEGCPQFVAREHGNSKGEGEVSAVQTAYLDVWKGRALDDSKRRSLSRLTGVSLEQLERLLQGEA